MRGLQIIPTLREETSRIGTTEFYAVNKETEKKLIINHMYATSSSARLTPRDRKVGKLSNYIWTVSFCEQSGPAPNGAYSLQPPEPVCTSAPLLKKSNMKHVAWPPCFPSA